MPRGGLDLQLAFAIRQDALHQDVEYPWDYERWRFRSNIGAAAFAQELPTPRRRIRIPQELAARAGASWKALRDQAMFIVDRLMQN
jgi:hypothetical protein